MIALVGNLSVDLPPGGVKLKFGGDNHAAVQRKSGYADSGACMRPYVGAEDLEDPIRERVQHVGGLGKARVGVDETLHEEPRGNAIQIAQRNLEATED